MAEGNGEIIEEMATSHKTDGNGEPERTADYPKLVEYGLDKRVNFHFYLHFHVSFFLKILSPIKLILFLMLNFLMNIEWISPLRPFVLIIGGSQIRRYI